MADTQPDDLDRVWREWRDTVNMTVSELEDWLDTPESSSVGDTSRGESTGQRAGRRTIQILQMTRDDLGDDDVAHMRKVIGYVHRHLAQRPSGDITHTRWRYSLMNWGHDPLK